MVISGDGKQRKLTLLVHFTVGSSGSICLQGHQPVVSLYTYTYSTDTYTHYEHLSINTKILHSGTINCCHNRLHLPSVHFKPMSRAARTSPSRMPRRPHRGWDELQRGFSHQTTAAGCHKSRPRPKPRPTPFLMHYILHIIHHLILIDLYCLW